MSNGTNTELQTAIEQKPNRILPRGTGEKTGLLLLTLLNAACNAPTEQSPQSVPTTVNTAHQELIIQSTIDAGVANAVATVEKRNDEEVAEYQQQIADLNYQLGELKGKLEAYESLEPLLASINANLERQNEIFDNMAESMESIGTLNVSEFNTVCMGDSECLELVAQINATHTELYNNLLLGNAEDCDRLLAQIRILYTQLTERLNEIASSLTCPTCQQTECECETETPTATATKTSTLTPTSTVTISRTPTPTKTPTRIFTNTPVPTRTPSKTPVVVFTPTKTPEPTSTSPVPTKTPTREPTPTNPPEPTSTPTREPTPTNPPEPTSTPTREPTPTNPPEPTSTPTPTNPPEPTSTPTREPTPTNPPEPTSTLVPTNVPESTEVPPATVVATEIPATTTPETGATSTPVDRSVPQAVQEIPIITSEERQAGARQLLSLARAQVRSELRSSGIKIRNRTEFSRLVDKKIKEIKLERQYPGITNYAAIRLIATIRVDQEMIFTGDSVSANARRAAQIEQEMERVQAEIIAAANQGKSSNNS